MKPLIYILVALTSLQAFGAYEDHFPTYFEYCTASQWKTVKGEKGGPAGHGFTYIHGLCKDYSQNYPQVVPCDEVTQTQHPHEGVGISLDLNYSNVSWVAVPGRDLILFGDIKSKAIQEDDIKLQVKKITDLKVFEGVKLKPAIFQTLQMGTPEYLEQAAIDTLGTDHAVNWARELHCVKIPFNKNKLKSVAEFLNQANLKYKDGPEYKWSMISNNCAHLAINTSHVLGINGSIGTDQFILKQLTDLAVPANLFMMYADLAVLKKPKAKSSYTPVQVGSLLGYYPAFETGSKFDTKDLRMMTLPRITKPFKLLMTPRKYKKYQTIENTDLKANAAKWRTLYSKFLQNSASNEYLENQLQLSEEILRAE